jgi:hypothetical protein
MSLLRSRDDAIFVDMGGANPTSQAGLDDTVDPAAQLARQGYKRGKHAVGRFAHDMVNRANSSPMVDRLYFNRPPNPLNLARLGGATVAGIAAESTTQNALNATRGGEYSENPYLAGLEKLGSRVVGGATTGAAYGKSFPGAVIGAIGGAGYDAIENAITAAKTIPEFYDLQRQARETAEIDERLRSRRPNQ